MIEIKDKENNIYYKNNPEYFDEIERIYFEKCSHSLQTFTRAESNKKYVKWMDEIMPFLKEKSIATKIYYLFNGLQTWIRCKNPKCNRELRGNVYRTRRGEFFPQQYCNAHCQMIDPQMKKHYEVFSIQKYGTKNPAQSEVVKEKMYATNLKRIGVKMPSCLPEIRAKQSETKRIRYGDENYNNIEKAKKTMLSKFGVESAMQSKELVNKFRENCFKKNGVYSYLQIPDIFKKTKTKYKYDGNYFHSSFEIAFYIWLQDNNMNFEYSPKISFEYEYNGVKHKYFPDFIVDGTIIEIKGEHFFKEDGTMRNPWKNKNWTEEQKKESDAIYEAKHQCMLKHGVKILRTKELKEQMAYVRKKYGKEFISSLRTK